MPATRGTMATLKKIAMYWSAAYGPAFLNLIANEIGWGEPFCFRCNWLIPQPADVDPEFAWESTDGWLERAHLVDFALDGPNTPDNLVPLCVLCHYVMPRFRLLQPAVNWVCAGTGRDYGWVFSPGCFGPTSPRLSGPTTTNPETAGSTSTSMSCGVTVAPLPRGTCGPVTAAPAFGRLAIEFLVPGGACWHGECTAGTSACGSDRLQPAAQMLGREFQDLGSVGPSGAGVRTDACTYIAVGGAETFWRGGARNTRREQAGRGS